MGKVRDATVLDLGGRLKEARALEARLRLLHKKLDSFKLRESTNSNLAVSTR